MGLLSYLLNRCGQTYLFKIKEKNLFYNLRYAILIIILRSNCKSIKGRNTYKYVCIKVLGCKTLC